MHFGKPGEVIGRPGQIALLQREVDAGFVRLDMVGMRDENLPVDIVGGVILSLRFKDGREL
jgi:hypothetical protein